MTKTNGCDKHVSRVIDFCSECMKEKLADARAELDITMAEQAQIIQQLADALDALFASNNKLAEARAAVSKLETISGEQRKAYFEQGHIMQGQADKLIARDELIEQMHGILRDVLRQHEPSTHDNLGCMFRDCLWCKIKAVLNNPK